MFNLINAHIKFNSIYKCDKCGCMKIGTTSVIDLTAHTPTSLAEQLETYNARPAARPYDWNYTNDHQFQCPKCLPE